MEINHANQLKEHVSQMNAMQNQLIAMERGQASRPQHRPNDKWPKKPPPQDQRPPNPFESTNWVVTTRLFIIVDLVSNSMMSQLAKSSFIFMVRRDLMELKMNKLICVVMSIVLACMIGWC
jgi:hypothetical protein